jgi:hypothetical protein
MIMRIPLRTGNAPDQPGLTACQPSASRAWFYYYEYYTADTAAKYP